MIDVIQDKQSKEYDLTLLNEMKQMQNIPANKFDSKIKQLMRKKSSCKLWWSNIETKIWDGKEYHEVNYRCCPSSHKARHFFGLLLDRSNDTVSVVDGWLEAV